MKIHVTKTEPSTKDEDMVVMAPEELDKVQASECTHIKLGDVLDFYEDRFSLLSGILSKIRYGGTLSMEGTDIGVLVRNTFNGRYSNQDINDILYKNKSSISDLQETRTFLLQSGMHVKKARYENHKFYLEAERPKPNG